MAAPITGFLFTFCISLVLYSLLIEFSHGLATMEQKDGCQHLNATWSFKTSDKTKKVSTYFKISHDNGSYFLFEAAVLPKNLPFIYENVRSKYDNLLAIRVELYDFLLVIKEAISTGEDSCKLYLKGGSIFEKVQSVDHVHVVFMNHLDVGYATNMFYPGTKHQIPGQIANVLNLYFQTYFPRAWRLANHLRAVNASESFIYTTHPWLVSLYLDCESIELGGIKLKCPSIADKDLFNQAVWKGDITWHAGPFNIEPESTNGDLYTFGLSLSQKLDQKYGLKRTARTLSLRDVPGMTQAAIPYLVKSGIVAASFGMNQNSPPAAVPSPNVWKFGNYSIITYWHKGGYPDPPGPDPFNRGGLSRSDCQFAKGTGHVLCFVFRTDNTGPPVNLQEIKKDYKIMRFEFPGAQIKASTFESFTEQLLPLKDKLPVVEKEVGDTWIQGPPSDPLKMSQYRLINRLRSQCLNEKLCDLNDIRVDRMSRYLLNMPEHSYGLNSPYDQKHWSNRDFQPLQHQEIGFLNNTNFWLSNRRFLTLAVEALEKHPLAARIRSGLKKLVPQIPNLHNYHLIPVGQLITCKNGMKLRIGKEGALTQLTDSRGREWADKSHPLALILYRTYNETDFDRNHRYYAYVHTNQMRKPNMGYTRAESKFWPVEAHGVYVKNKEDPCSSDIYVRVLHTHPQTWFKYGAPDPYLLKYQIVNQSVEIEYTFYNKPSTRLPEALFLDFKPLPKSGSQFYLQKLGYLVDPMNVVLNGSQYVHAVDEGVVYMNKQAENLVIESLDVATVTVRTPTHPPAPFPSPMTPLDDQPTSMAFNIYNNIWETNFIYWYPYMPQDKHYKARFRISFP